MVPGVFHPNRASYEPLRTQEAGNHQLACLRGGFGIARGIQGQPGAGSCGVLSDGNSQHHYDDLTQPACAGHRPCRQTRRHPYSGTILQVPRLNGRSPAYAAGGGTFARYGFSGNGGYTKYDVNNIIVDSFGNAADSISDAADKFEEVFDWFEVLLEEIEDNISLMNAKLENAVGISAKKGIYSEIINTEQFKLQELYEGVKLYSDYANKLLARVPDQYKEMAKNGAVAITNFLGEANEEVVESINNYREWANKVTDLNQQLEETKKKRIYINISSIIIWFNYRWNINNDVPKNVYDAYIFYNSIFIFELIHSKKRI